MSEISKASDLEYHGDVVLNEIAVNPQKGDTIVKNPRTEDEVKYVVTFVGQEGQNLAQHDNEGKYLGTEYTTLDVVKFTYTLRGKTMNYTRTRDQFAGEMSHLSSQRDIIECSRGF